MDEFETVRAYADNIQAELARAHLQANGIDAVVVESAAFNPMINAALGIDLRVPTRDVPLARAMLAQLGTQSEEDDDATDDDTVRCPVCESEYCYFEGPIPQGHYGAHPLVAVANIVAKIETKRWRCRKCEHEWYDEAEGRRGKTRIAKGLPKLVFRMYRGNPGTGILAGIMVSLLAAIVWPELAVIVAILAIAAGWLIGRGIGVDVCSDRNCRHVLPPNVDECPGCKGLVSGRIRAAHEHYRAAAEVRRELAKAMADDEEKQEPSEKRRNKKAPGLLTSVKGSPRRTIPVFATVIALVVFVGGLYALISERWTTRANTKDEPASIAKPEVFEGKAAPYHITVPNSADWKQGPSIKDRDMVLEHRATGAAIVVDVDPLDNPFLTAADVAEMSLDNTKRSGASFRIRSRESFGDADAAVLVHLTSSGKDNTYDHLLAYFTQDDSAYQVEGIVSTLHFAELRTEMETILRSFTLPARNPQQTTLPAHVLGLPAPAAPSAQYRELDLQNAPRTLIADLAYEAQNKKEYEGAVQLWHWAIARRGFTDMYGMYDLACAYSHLGQKDAAFYWLERAAAEQGVDPSWAEQDADLEVLRKDARWTPIRSYLLQVARYWQHTARKQTLFVLPKDYKPGKPIPVVIGLHGHGSVPADFAGSHLQPIADANSVAFIGVSGTIPLGPLTYRWVESAIQDEKRIDAALAEVAAYVTVSPGQIILIGFSQGAQMAVEIAARRPDRYAGAIAMSPGTRRHLGLGTVERIAGIEKRRFVVVVGAGELPGNVEVAKQDAERLRTLGAEVQHKEYENQAAHSFPADYEKALPEWIRFILGSQLAPKTLPP